MTLQMPTTGFRDLDELIGGFEPGVFITLAGRYEAGKTGFALNLAYNVLVRERQPVIIITKQLTEHEITEHLDWLHRGVWSSSPKDEARRSLGELPLYINQSLQHMDAIEDAVIAQVKTLDRPVGLIVIDGVLSIGVTDLAWDEHLPDVSRRLKLLAKTVRAPVLGTLILPHVPAHRSPILADFGDADSFVADSDIVCFIERLRDPEHAGLVEIGVAKHRQGNVGRFPLGFETSTKRYRNLNRVQP